MSNFGLSTASVDLKGDFNTNEPTKFIPLDLYGFLPQLQWFNGSACFPTSVTNALTGMATFYQKPELLVSGENRNDQLLNTMKSLANKLETTNAGTYSTNYVKGIEGYFVAKGIPNQISVNWLNEDDKIVTLPELVSAFAKGPVILHDKYRAGGGHALTAVELKLDDANNNMRIDKGEAYVKVIDPLNPATGYIQTEPPEFDKGKTQEDYEIWSATIQAAPDAKPNIQKVEIYQDQDDNIIFDYLQSAVVPDSLKSGFDIQATASEGIAHGIVSLNQSSIQANVDELIAPSKESDVVFDFSSFIENGSVSAELFSYLNEGSSFDNNLSFYQLADSSGTIIDPITRVRLSPGDNGYIELAQKQAKIFEASDSNDSNADLGGRVSADQTQMGSFSFSLDSVGGTALFAPIVNTSAGDTWTTFGAANADGEDHFKWMGGLSFQMEDEYGLGDRDFNDLQVVLTPLEINGVA